MTQYIRAGAVGSTHYVTQAYQPRINIPLQNSSPPTHRAAQKFQQPSDLEIKVRGGK